MKVTYERRIKELQEKINTLESDVKEKNKENKLNSIKMKDILRFHLDSSIKKTVALPDLNNSLINDNSNKVSMTPKSSQLSETNSNRRSKSIDPQSIHEETKPKVDSNLLSRLRKVKAPSNNMSTLVNKTETTFENELEKASNAKIATINNAIPKIKANNTEVVLGQSALLNHAKQTIAKRVNKAVKGWIINFKILICTLKFKLTF